MEIKDTLISIRESRGYSKKSVSELTGIPYTTYTKYESGERKDVSMQALCKLADFYGVTADYLLGRETASEQETLTSLNLTEKEKAFIRTYAEFSPEKREHFMEILSGLSKIM